MQAFPQQQRGHPFQNSLPGVAPLLLRKGLHLPGREALSERKTGFLSGLTLVVALVLERWLYELPSSIHVLSVQTDRSDGNTVNSLKFLRDHPCPAGVI